MKKVCNFLILLAVSVFSIYAQDLIVLRDGNIIEAIVTEISPAEIRYKRYDHQDGPTIVLSINSVLSIRYRNGRVETFGTVPEPQNRQPPGSSSRAEQPQTTVNSQENPYLSLARDIAIEFGVPSSIQEILNSLPPIRIAGRSLKFLFSGETWTANVNGRPFATGTVSTMNIEGGYVLILSQTHTYIRGRQIDTPNLTMHLEYKPGPPVSFRALSGSELPEGLAEVEIEGEQGEPETGNNNGIKNWLSAEISFGSGISGGLEPIKFFV